MQHLMWLPRIVLACVSQASSKAAGSSELLLYPRYHLDNASLLAQYHLPQVRARMRHSMLCAQVDVLYALYCQQLFTMI